MLTLTFLGVGSAFAKRNYQSNALVEAWSAGPDKQIAPDDTLLIDFGATGPFALHALKSEPGFAYLDDDGVIRYSAIRRIFVTHQHSDHVGGLEELAGMNVHHVPDSVGARRWFKPQLIGAAEVLTALWTHTLQGGLGVLDGRQATLADYFDLLALRTADAREPQGFALLDRYEFVPIRTDHIRLREPYDWPSFGLRMVDQLTGASVVYSGDTRFDPEGLARNMASARLSFHEVQLDDQADPVHATLSDLSTLPPNVRGKTVLYHYDDAWDDEAYAFVAEMFAGFARPRHRYVLFE